MARPTLVEADITVGMDATKALSKDDKLRPTAALWLYDDSAREWRFFVATEDVRKRGLTAAYLRVRNTLKRAGLLDQLPLRRVVVSDPLDPLIDALSNVIRTPDDELASTTFINCVFNQVSISGMHVYLLKKASGVAKKATLLPALETRSEENVFVATQ